MASPELRVLDVGHGNAAMISGESTAVVDCPRSTALQDTLRELQIKNVQAVVVSHSDADHIIGLTGLLQDPDVTVESVYVNPDTSKATASWDEFRRALTEAKARTSGVSPKIRRVSADDPGEIQLGSDVVLQILLPTGVGALSPAGGRDPDGKKVGSNDASAVVLVRRGGESVALLAGDLTGKALAELDGAAATARILVFPHHGGLPGGGVDTGKFAEKLIELVQPELVVFSNGRTSGTTPRREILDAIHKSERPCGIVCTQLSQQCSALTVDVDRTYLIEHSEGFKSSSSCAGTIVFPLGDGLLDASRLAGHRTFIRDHIPNAMCVAPPTTGGGDLAITASSDR